MTSLPFPRRATRSGAERFTTEMKPTRRPPQTQRTVGVWTTMAGRARSPRPRGDGVIWFDTVAVVERRARIERMIEAYHLARRRRLLKRAKRLWRKAQTERYLAGLDKPSPSVH